MGQAVTGPDLRLIAGNAHPRLAEALAAELSIPLHPTEMEPFADGEQRVRVGDGVSGRPVALLQPMAPPVDEHLMGLALLADAVRAAGADRIVAVVPYFGYARQDRREEAGEPRSAQVVAKLLAAVGVDHLITLDLHVPSLESALPMPTTLLPPEELFLPLIECWALEAPVIVAPDAGGIKRAQQFARLLETDLAVVAKQRPRPDAPKPMRLLGEVRDRACLIVDDMVSTGRTLAGAAETLQEAGADGIDAFFTHAVMAPGALDRLEEAPLTRLGTSDSIPLPGRHRFEVVSTVPLLARTVRRCLAPGAPH